MPVQGQERGAGLGQDGGAWHCLPGLEKAQVLPNKAGRFSQVCPVAPLILPGIHSLRAEPHLLAKRKKKKKEPKELIVRDGTLRR